MLHLVPDGVVCNGILFDEGCLCRGLQFLIIQLRIIHTCQAHMNITIIFFLFFHEPLSCLLTSAQYHFDQRKDVIVPCTRFFTGRIGVCSSTSCSDVSLRTMICFLVATVTELISAAARLIDSLSKNCELNVIVN